MKISQMFHISPILFTACASFTAIAQYPRSSHALSSTISSHTVSSQFLVSGVNVQEASLRRQISMKLLMSEISRGMLAVLSD
jgi:hypothetical protein